MQNEKVTFKMIDENGIEKEYEMLFTTESEEIGKSYVCYTDNETDETGALKVFGGYYKDDEEEFNIYPITSEEWSVLREILDKLQNEEN